MFSGLKFIAGLLLALLPLSGQAGEITLDDVVRTLERPFQRSTPVSQRIDGFRGKFKQQSRVAAIDRVQQGAGEVSFKFDEVAGQTSLRPRFHWDYRLPTEQTIISDGSTLWVYIPDNLQVVRSDVSQIRAGQGENPLTLLNGLGNLSSNFTIAWADRKTDERGNYRLALSPRQNSQLVQSMAVLVSHRALEEWLQQQQTGATFPLLATEVIDAQGNRTRITFHQVEINKDLPDKLFQFQPPADVEVVTPEELSF